MNGMSGFFKKKKLGCRLGGELKHRNLVSHNLLKVKNPPWEDYKTEVSSFSPLPSFVLTILCIYVLIDWVGGQDGWILGKFLFCAFMDRDGIFTLSFGRLRQRIVLKFVPHVQHDYFPSFNQSDHCFLVSSFAIALVLPLKLPIEYITQTFFLELF